MSWLKDYVEHTLGQESPEIFHVWAGITTLAAALGRNVWLSRRSRAVTKYKLYPGQLITVLVAGSGALRKTTAINQTKPFLRAINKPTIGGKSSPEAFLKQLDPAQQGTPQAMLLEDEMTVFISKQTWAEPLVEIMIKLADAPDDFAYKTISHGPIVIPEPCITGLMATTPESLGDRLPTGAHGSGFTSRVTFVFASETDRIDDLTDVDDEDVTPEEIQAATQRSNRMTLEIQRIKTLAGPFTYTKDGRAWFRAWYKKYRESPAAKGEGWPARRHDHMLRIAMILSIAKGGPGAPLEIDDRSLISADKLLYMVEQGHDKAFAFVGTAYAKDRQRIVEFITIKAGKATTNEIVAALYSYFQDQDTLKRTLRLLQAAGVLKYSVSGGPPAIECWELAGFSVNLP